MKITISELRRIIREEWWAEAYDKQLTDDASFNSQSLLVPDDIKNTLKKWMRSMGLSGIKKKKRRR